LEVGENVIILDLVKSQTWGNVIDRKHLICQCGLLLLIWDRETLIVYIGPHLQREEKTIPEEEKPIMVLSMVLSSLG